MNIWTLLVPEPVVVVQATPEMWDAPASPAERACVDKAIAKRKLEFQAGRAAARVALRALGVEGFDLLPGDDRAPRWPPGIVGSITHTASHCAVAVARVGDILAIGIDVERNDPLTPGLVPRICSASEEQRLQSLPGATPLVWAKLIFSAKEAFFKAYYPETGKYIGFHDAEVEIQHDQGKFRIALTGESAPPFFGRRHASGRFAVGQGYIFTSLVVDARGG